MRLNDPDEFVEETKEEVKQTFKETVTYDSWYDWYYDQGSIHVEYLYPEKTYDLIQSSCFEEFQSMLLGCLNCWTDLDVFRVPNKNHYFNRMGMFAWHPDDFTKMKIKIAGQGDIVDTLKVIQENMLKISSASNEDNNLENIATNLSDKP